VALQPLASVAITVKLDVLVAVGVPVIAPLLASINPLGSEPEMSENV
jgi:hypothetical protein